jgi:hypothetical protein
VASILKKPKKKPVYGDILVMKNGPIGGSWEVLPDVDISSLAKTIWWYKASGVDISTIFGERGFSRVLRELSP